MAKSEINLLNRSGCLSREAIISRHNNTLDPSELEIVESHLAQCPFCREALEGYSENPDEDPAEILTTLDITFKKRIHNKDSRKLYLFISVAAGILAFAGLFTLLKFQQVKKETPLAEQLYSIPVPLPAVRETDSIQAPEKAERKYKHVKSKAVKPQEITENEIISEDALPAPSSAASGATSFNEPKPDVVAAISAKSDETQEVEKKTEAKAEMAKDRSAEKLAVYRSINRNSDKSANSIPVSEKAASANDNETVFYVVEESPQFQGGDLSNFTRYVISKLNNSGIKGSPVQGKIITSFIVDEKGSIRDVILIKGIKQAVDSTTLNIIRNSPSWKPGKQGGKSVRVKLVLPVFIDLKN